MIRAYYEAGDGTIINLDRYPYKMETADLLDYEWSYVTNNNRISYFKKGLKTKSMTIHILGDTVAEYAVNWKRIHDTFGKDVSNMTPGKLHINSCYLLCYIYADTVDLWTKNINHTKNEFKLVAEKPVWIEERTVSVHNVAGATGKTYNYTYPYTYGVRQITNINIDHYGASDFRIIAYGPFDSFYMTIGPNTYNVLHSVSSNEYLVIDSRETADVGNACYIVSSTGAKTNVFDYRNPKFALFAQIPAGNQPISYSGEHGLELTVFIERSTPLWT